MNAQPITRQDVDTLYADISEGEASSNDMAQILDDWFVEHGYASVLYR